MEGGRQSLMCSNVCRIPFVPFTNSYQVSNYAQGHSVNFLRTSD